MSQSSLVACSSHCPRSSSIPYRCFCSWWDGFEIRPTPRGGTTLSAGLLLSLRDGMTAAPAGEAALVVQGSRRRVTLRRLAPVLLDCLCRLDPPGENEDRLAELVQSGGNGSLARWFYYLEYLTRRGFLSRSVHSNGTRLATLVAVSSSFVSKSAQAVPGRRYVLSRFAYLRRESGEA